MTQSSSPVGRNGNGKIAKLIFQLVTGALVGGAVTFGFLTFLGEGGFEIDDPNRAVGLIAGLSFILMGVGVGFGTILPGTGAKYLNVEDADELREQRPALWQGSLVLILVGAALLALSLAAVGGSAGILSVATAAWAAAACAAGLVLLTIVGGYKSDEMMKQVSTESSALTLYIGLVLLGVWAGLAHLGYVAWIEPLGLISGLLLLQLGAIFWVSATKGLIRPR